MSDPRPIPRSPGRPSPGGRTPWHLAAAAPAAALLVALLPACTAHRYASPKPGFVERGIASWYGSQFHGRPTASGEIYDMHGLTAAHRELPLGTVVEVENLDNGRSVRVEINDRGPFVRGRILDLSYGAAQKLRMVDAGLARVEIRIAKVGTGRPGPSRTAAYVVQVGAFRDRDNALDLLRRLDDHSPGAEIRTGDDGLHRVWAGRFEKRSDAERRRRQLAAQGLDAVLVGLAVGHPALAERSRG